MSLNLNELEAAVGKMTPAPWTGDRYDGTVKYCMLGPDRVIVIAGDNGNADEGPYGTLRTEDEIGIMALRNAAPELIAAAREREELAALLREAKSNLQLRMLDDGCVPADVDFLDRIDAALAKVGAS